MNHAWMVVLIIAGLGHLLIGTLFGTVVGATIGIALILTINLRPRKLTS